MKSKTASMLSMALLIGVIIMTIVILFGGFFSAEAGEQISRYPGFFSDKADEYIDDIVISDPELREQYEERFRVSYEQASSVDPAVVRTTFSDLEPEFIERVNEAAFNLNIPAEYLFSVMAFETAGTFDPAISNPHSSATGLIQFMESTAREYGTTTEELSRMSRVEQMDYVERYFQRASSRPLRTFEDVYMAVLWPAGVGRGRDYVIFEEGSSQYNVNSGLDANGRGGITVGEAADSASSRFPPCLFVEVGCEQPATS